MSVAGAVRLGGWPAAVFLVVTSALAVVLIKDESRRLFVDLQSLERTRDELNMHWSRLKIEGRYRASHDRIWLEAKTRLGMDRPAPERIVIVDIEY